MSAIKIFTNAWVRPRGVEEIALLTRVLRQRCGFDDVDNLNVVDLLRRFEHTDIPGKGRLKIVVHSERPRGYRAYVSFNPLELHVERLTFERARWNAETDSKYVLAHETGHATLHNQFGVPFSDGDLQRRVREDGEDRAETQADLFADYLLLPDHIVDKYATVESLMDACGVSAGLAKRRFGYRQGKKAVESLYAGDFCNNCANATLQRRGLLLQCHTCGESFPDL